MSERKREYKLKADGRINLSNAKTEEHFADVNHNSMVYHATNQAHVPARNGEPESRLMARQSILDGSRLKQKPLWL